MNNKIVIYTAIIGDYDAPQKVSIVHENIDYVCITKKDYPFKVPKPWIHRHHEDSSLSNKDLARYCKIYCHKLFPNHQISIWLDGNIGISGDINKLLNTQFKNADVALYEHWCRTNVHQELYICALLGHDYAWELRKQSEKYQNTLDSKKFYETNVLIRRHNKENVKNAMKIWWNEYQSGGKRDQYGFLYAMENSRINLLSLGTHDPRLIRKYFSYSLHEKSKKLSIIKLKKLLKIIINRIYIAIFLWKVTLPEIPETVLKLAHPDIRNKLK